MTNYIISYDAEKGKGTLDVNSATRFKKRDRKHLQGV